MGRPLLSIIMTEVFYFFSSYFRCIYHARQSRMEQVTENILSGRSMNIPAFDYSILSYLSSLSGDSTVLDSAILGLANNNLLKGGVLVTLFWWVWFNRAQQDLNGRVHVIATILSAIAAMGAARVLSNALPFRLRPVHAVLGLDFPTGAEIRLIDWSSFPGDHAALFYTLSVGLLFASRRVGVFALAYTTLVICFPRLYVGWNYPTDIIGGAVVGSLCGLVGNLKCVSGRFSEWILRWEFKAPEHFYSLFFLMSYQIADLFDASRQIADFLYRIARPYIM